MDALIFFVKAIIAVILCAILVVVLMVLVIIGAALIGKFDEVDKGFDEDDDYCDVHRGN